MNNTVDMETNQTSPNQEDTTDNMPKEDYQAAESADDGASDESMDESMENLMDMYEESFKRFAEGEVVTGKIISVDKDHVLVDIGYKSEGQIRINEFRLFRPGIH